MAFILWRAAPPDAGAPSFHTRRRNYIRERYDAERGRQPQAGQSLSINELLASTSGIL